MSTREKLIKARLGMLALAGCPSQIDLCLLAEPSRDLVQSHHPAGHSPWHLPQRQGTGAENRRLCAQLQRDRKPLCLDGHCGFDLRQATKTL